MGCVPLALGATALLRELGLPVAVTVGVAPGTEGRPLSAHAWAESDGLVVVGDATDREYVPLFVAEPPR